MNASTKLSRGAQRISSHRKLRSRVTGVLLFAVALWCSGCQSPHVATLPPGVIAPSTGALAPGDVLKISFTGARQHDLTQKIRPDGRISLPMVGEVTASGKTVAALQAELSRLYQSQLQDSEVVVMVDSRAAAVYVMGAVNKPGKIPLERPMTAFEAIMEAGGFDQGLANLKKVILVRNENGRQFTQTLDLSPAISERSSAAFFLKPYDVICVQERFF